MSAWVASSASDVEEAQAIAIRATLIALGDVAWDA